MALTKVKGSVWDTKDNGVLINVKDLGAKGDGVTDDTAAILAADALGPLNFISGTYLVSGSVTLTNEATFSGGIIKLAAAATVTFSKDIVASSGVTCFDCSSLTFSEDGDKGAGWNSSWSTVGGVRLPTIAYATWFGCSSSSADNTRNLQVFFDSRAKMLYLDGMFTHTTNFLNDNQVLSGFGNGTGFKQKVKTVSIVPQTQSTSDNIWGQNLFGLTVKSGLNRVTLKDFEYDGQASLHYDRSNMYDAMWNGSTLDFNLLKFNNITGGGGSDGRSSHVAPIRVEVERVYSHDAVRNCFIFNSGVVEHLDMVGCSAKNSDCDHFVYAEYAKNVCITDFICDGFARSGFIVTGSSVVQGLLVKSLTANPVWNLTRSQRFNTTNIVVQRETGSPNAGSSLSGVRINGDVSLIHATVEPVLFSVEGDNGSISDVAVYNTGAASSSLIVVSFADNSDTFHLNNVRLLAAPQTFYFARGQGRTLTNLKFSNLHASLHTSSAAASNAIFDFQTSTTTNVVVNNVSVVGPSAGTGPRRILSEATTMTHTLFSDVYCPSTDNAYQSFNINLANGPITDFIANRVTARCQRPAGDSLSSIKWIDCYYGASYNSPTRQRGIYVTSGNGATATFSITNSVGTANYFTVKAGSADSRGVFHVSPGLNFLSVVYAVAPIAGASNVTLYWEADLSIL